jgi:hypothetical protein
MEDKLEERRDRFEAIEIADKEILAKMSPKDKAVVRKMLVLKAGLEVEPSNNLRDETCAVCSSYRNNFCKSFNKKVFSVDKGCHRFARLYSSR